MPFLQEASSPQLQDPWDWTVDQVVFALTNDKSFLLKANETLSLPIAAQFANVLYENDVSGLALLTEVHASSLRDDLKIKSMGHRASINHLIRQLQDMSFKYQEQIVMKSGRASSAGTNSRFGTPFLSSPQKGDPMNVSDTDRFWVTPSARSDHFQNLPWLESVTAGAQERLAIPRRDIFDKVPGFSRPEWHKPQSVEEVNQLAFGAMEQSNEKSESEKTQTYLDTSNAFGDFIVENDDLTNKNAQSEVTIVDERGKKRRRLILPSKDASEQADLGCSAPGPNLPPCNTSQSFRMDVDGVDPVTTMPVKDSGRSAGDSDELSADALGVASPLQIIQSEPEPQSLPEPGAVHIDEHGRKRVRPFLIAPSESVLEDNRLEQPQAATATNTLDKSTQFHEDMKFPSYHKQRPFGRKAIRTKYQIYLGPEPLPVDELFYGDVSLDSRLDCPKKVDPTDDTDNISIEPCAESSNGLSLYVNARIKYYLQAQAMKLQMGKTEGVAVVPYPSRIGRKHYPLSLTVFSSSPSGISASRSNRSQWIKTSAQMNSNHEANAFHVADPVLAQDDDGDAEWTALEKWKYLDDEDHILPVYGESGSEGEYELDTWREIELERGDMERPTGISRSKKLSATEVKEVIERAVEEILARWSSKQKPKLQRKAWRIWMKSRRNNDMKVQTDDINHAIEILNNRLVRLQKDIAEEEWSNHSQIRKQCEIMQPSIYDREDGKWKITILSSRKCPEKPAPTDIKVKANRSTLPEEGLQDGEENLLTDVDDSESSNGSLEDFIVQDDSEAEEYEPNDPDEYFSMPDGENMVDSGIITEANHTDSDFLGGDNVKVEPITAKAENDGRTMNGISFGSTIVDLTLESDPIEPRSSNPPEYKPPSGIKTPPVNDSENESDVFQRSRKKKAVFKKVSLPQTSHVINLESDSHDVNVTPTPTAIKKQLPSISDIIAVKSMDPSGLVERQDRKRLLTWIVAHAPARRRQAASDYLTKVSYEIASFNNTKALERIRKDKRYMSGMDNETSDSIMSIASWHVCWTIPVKTDQSGIDVSHIDITLADEGGFAPFHDFLLECLSHCLIAMDAPDQATPKKKKEKIVQEAEESLNPTPFRKRKFAVLESQQTLNQRKAAQNRMRADHERRREEKRRSDELAVRFKNMGSIKHASKVVVNPGKLEDQEYIYLNPDFGKRNGARMKEHQKDGLQFLWREITGEHEDLQGCLLAQTMGLGKTMQIIALLVTLAESSQSQSINIRNQVPPSLQESRTIILCPPALLENWWDEFLIWAPRPFSETIGELRKVSVSLSLQERLDEIDAWSEQGGVLLIGYDTFKGLVLNPARVNKKTGNVKISLDDSKHEEIREALLHRANLVVADEAHNFKRRTSQIHKAMNQFETKSRIALTGSPLNNNLEEYYTLIDWIAPNYLGTYIEFKATYEEPISEGLYQDSTVTQYTRSRTKLKALEIEMEPKVHRADVSVLHTDLHGKMEFVIVVPLTKLQEDIYNIFVETMRPAVSKKETRTTSFWSWLSVLQLLCNHPQCFKEQMLTIKTEFDNSPDGRTAIPLEKTGPTTLEEKLTGSDEDDLLLATAGATPEFMVIIHKCEELFDRMSESEDHLLQSYKMSLLMSILKFSGAAHDKVLVFSHRLATLKYIRELLDKENRGYVYIDGTLLTQKRQQFSKYFNEGNINICLISTRAGGTGLNFYGANRVVILDEHFNPSWEQQAIGRAYRIGQRKPVYVYRLTVGGTFEEAMQKQGLFKQQLATRVVDKKNPNRIGVKRAGEYFFPPRMVVEGDVGQCLGQDPLVLDRLLADRMKNRILSVTPSEIFHVEDGVILTEEQKLEAEKMVESEQLRRRNPQAHFELLREQERERDLKRWQQIQSVREHTKISASEVGPMPFGSFSSQQNGTNPVTINPVATNPQAPLRWKPPFYPYSAPAYPAAMNGP